MNDFFEEILVVLVIYKMEIVESPAYRSLTNALVESNKSVPLFIYDNSPVRLDAPHASRWLIDYHHDPSNPGVSKAYNEGFKKAKFENKKWLLLTDQDTTFPTNIFEKYSHSVMNSTARDLFVPLVKYEGIVISPFRFELGRGRGLADARPGIYSLDHCKFINSGMLVSTNLFEKCKGYDERFPLDFSDIVFIERLKTVTREFVLVDLVCTQALSAGERSFENALRRFRIFVDASRMYAHLYGLSSSLFLNRFLRAIKLSLKFRSLMFITIMFD